MPPGTLGGRILEALDRSGAYQGTYIPTWDVPLCDTGYLLGLEYAASIIVNAVPVKQRARTEGR